MLELRWRHADVIALDGPTFDVRGQVIEAASALDVAVSALLCVVATVLTARAAGMVLERSVMRTGHASCASRSSGPVERRLAWQGLA